MNRSLEIQNLENFTAYEGQIFEISGEELVSTKGGHSNFAKHLQRLNVDNVKIIIHNTYPNIRLSYDLKFYQNNQEVDAQSLTDELFLRYILRLAKLIQDVSSKVDTAPGQTYSFLNLEKKAGDAIHIQMNDAFVKDFFKADVANLMTGKQWSLKIIPQIQGCFIQSLPTFLEKNDGTLVTEQEFYGANSSRVHELMLSIQEHYEFLRTLEKYVQKHQVLVS